MRIAIINSTGFWPLGWAIEPKTQQPVLDSLRRAGIVVDVYEADSRASLSRVIEQIKQAPCLVWANAYSVAETAGSTDSFWLADVLREHQLPFIGSDGQTLHNVLHKHQCQALLEEAGLPIPAFAAINEPMLAELDNIIAARSMTFPLFVKPDALSSSVGISQDCIVNDLQALADRIKQIGSDFGYPVMVEEFLPGTDITIAVFDTGEEQLLLPTYYSADNHDGAEAVLDRTDRLQDWGGTKQMRLVTDEHVLAQIPGVALPVCKALGILDVTRMDCRVDRNGKLKVFDVNGLPGLEFPDSVTVWQMITKLSHLSELEAFDTLIYLIVYCAAKRHGLNVPTQVKEKAQAHLRKYVQHQQTGEPA
jgi:D-alanine-D-alanine ligase-like ATP-grasp enzyme